VPAAPKPGPGPSKAARRRQRFEENYGGEDYRNYIASLPCAICGAERHSVSAHVIPRSRGGKAEHTVPLCSWPPIRGCHEKFDAYEKEYRVHEPRLLVLAGKLRSDWLATHGEET